MIVKLTTKEIKEKQKQILERTKKETFRKYITAQLDEIALTTPKHFLIKYGIPKNSFENFLKGINRLTQDEGINIRETLEELGIDIYNHPESRVKRLEELEA